MFKKCIVPSVVLLFLAATTYGIVIGDWEGIDVWDGWQPLTNPPAHDPNFGWSDVNGVTLNNWSLRIDTPGPDWQQRPADMLAS